jgi:hypothetical protein
MCRIRRVKCDEGWPDCQKCKSTGRVCDRYSSSSGRSHNDETLPCEILTQDSAVSIIEPLRLEMSNGGPLKRSDFLSFFQTQTLPQLSQYHNCKLWTQLILQFATTELSVYHSVLAVGAIHRASVELDQKKAVCHREYAFGHYQLAIRYLIDLKNSAKSNAILISCCMFIWFENLQGDYQKSLSHLRNGLKFLARNSKGHNHLSIHQVIVFQLSRLDIQASSWDPTWAPQFYNFQRDWSLLTCFENLEAAQTELDQLILKMLQLRRPEVSPFPGSYTWPVPECEAMAGRIEISKNLYLWLEVMELFLKENHLSLGPTELSLGQLLRLHCNMALAFLSVDEYMDERCWDDSLLQFLNIISLATSFIKRRESKEGCITFPNQLGVLPAIFLVGVKCRHPLLRRRALELLVTKRREGIWDSLLAAKIVERIISLEEDGLVVSHAADIPSSSRVRRTWVERRGDGIKAAILSHQIVGHLGQPRAIVKEHITWS